MKAVLLHKLSLESTIKRDILIMLLAFGMSGCATLTKPGGLFYSSGQQLKLSKAVALLQKGDSSTAIGLLNDICAEPPVPGVTDEALFLSIILRLESVRDRNKIEQAQYDLELLVAEYRPSSWSTLASSLKGLLASINEARQHEDELNELNLSLEQEIKELQGLNLSKTKELKAIKESNISLTKENSGLHDTIEKLKSKNLELADIIEQLKKLDLELGNKPHQ